MTIPGALVGFLDEIGEELGLFRSEVVAEMIFYVSMPENLEDFMNKFVLELPEEEEEEFEDFEEEEEEDFEEE